MSATNQTANLHLPVFVGDDKPAWLTDWNGAMNTIDGAVASAQTDIDGVETTVATQGGQISSLNTTVGNHTTSINALTDATTHNAGDINTINSLIGNGTPTTTDQTIIGAINELHADQGDLDDLTTTDKSSLVAAINEAAQSGGAAAYTKISVTGDGTKTLSQICDELVAALAAHNAAMRTGGKCIALSAVVYSDPLGIPAIEQSQSSTGQMTFSAFNIASDYNMYNFRVLLKTSGSEVHQVSIDANGTVSHTDLSSTASINGREYYVKVLDI